jgi:tetratricopeptide (TPR) repeat protein
VRAIPPQKIEVVLEPLNDAETSRRVKVLLFDRSRQATRAEGPADLDLRNTEVSTGFGTEAFLAAFLRGDALGRAEGMGFGRLLFERLFSAPAVRDLWRELQLQRESREGKQRMQVLLVSPREEAWLASIPFELLCDEDGFLFYSRGHSLIRTLKGLKAGEASLLPGESALVAWANPDVDEELRPVPAADLDAHEKAVEQAAREFGWNILPACRHATRESLRERLREAQPPVQVLSLLAHGDESGGAVYLASARNPQLGEPISATELGGLLQGTGVKLIFLWSCYGGQRPPVGSAVAEALLHPEYGGVLAVIAAPGALRAASTVPFFRELLRSLRDETQGDLERAVALARRAIPEADLQWAAPAYYARPLDGRTVDVSKESEQALRLLAGAPPALVEQADELTVHFHGREQQVEELLGQLRKGARFITIVGLPGVGKTQLAVAVAQAARREGALGLDRAIWIRMEGVTEVAALRDQFALIVGLKPDECQEDAVLADRIGSQRLLTVLDNAEDLLRDTGQAVRFLKFLDTLFHRCPGLRVIVSSRKPVGSQGAAQELVRNLDRIEPPADREVFLSWVRARAEEEVSPAEAERFVQVLQASSELAPLLEILGGHPLSLVLVAGQVLPGTSLRTLRERIEQDVDTIRERNWLDSDLDAVADQELRLVRLKSSLNLSFLPLREKHPLAASIFTWFGHLPAGLHLEMVPVLFGDQADAQVEKLRRAYLVRDREGRVGLLAPIQRYALLMRDSTLETQQREEWLLRSVQVIGGWLSVLASKVGTLVAGPAMAEALREVPNVRTLVEQVVEKPDASDELMQAFSGLVVAHAVLMQHVGQARGALRACERAASSLRGRPGEANTLQALGALYVRTDRLKEAEEAYGKALPLYQQIDDRLGEANTLQALGDLYVRTDRLKEAEEAYGKALPLYQQIDARLGEANMYQALGTLELAQGRAAAAFSQYLKALELHRAVDPVLGQRSV